MLVKRSIFTIGVLVIFSAVEWILYSYLRWETFRDLTEEGAYAMVENISQFFPLMSLYNLIEQPFLRYGQRLSPEEIPIQHDFSLYWYEIAIALAWTAIFIFLSYRLLKKRDL